jgi:hypothetical protein
VTVEIPGNLKKKGSKSTGRACFFYIRLASHTKQSSKLNMHVQHASRSKSGDVDAAPTPSALCLSRRDDGQDGDGNATGTSILSVLKEPSRSWLKGSKSTERVLDSSQPRAWACRCSRLSWRATGASGPALAPPPSTRASSATATTPTPPPPPPTSFSTPA